MVIDTNDSFIFNNAYTEVEYIESTGTQYIDTNFVASINTRLQLQTLFNTTSNLGLYGGQMQDVDTGLRVFTSGNTLYVAHGGNRYQQTHTIVTVPVKSVDKRNHFLPIQSICRCITAFKCHFRFVFCLFVKGSKSAFSNPY